MNKKAKISLVVAGLIAVIAIGVAIYSADFAKAENPDDPPAWPDYTSDVRITGSESMKDIDMYTTNGGSAQAQSWSETKMFIKTYGGDSYPPEYNNSYTYYYWTPPLAPGQTHHNVRLKLSCGEWQGDYAGFEVWSGADHYNWIYESNENNNNDYASCGI
ncbi:MAG TPA: hypothetical protein HA282_00150 [Nanoarchaeota archaeon]|nr:hypothetical protein [Candidatus Pacearchaeota archaeon]HIH17324.1 hypothetical protein [Nanoarchaeota archaeon]HIH34186.1 hypothetical protein [Nanoarchaeota archaeon]HIH51584.1 hypothetical protein [Nanoarchaeota archaeon]HIH65612.1 hypothetical protein [Nanoarchaeota archaeon]